MVADHQSGEHQAGVTVQWFPTEYSINHVPRKAGVRLCGRLDRMTRLFCCSENTLLHSRPCNFLAAIEPTTDITELYPVVAVRSRAPKFRVDLTLLP